MEKFFEKWGKLLVAIALVVLFFLGYCSNNGGSASHEDSHRERYDGRHAY